MNTTTKDRGGRRVHRHRPPRQAPDGVQTYRQCGCWYEDACIEEFPGGLYPCFWVEPNLCSACK